MWNIKNARVSFSKRNRFAKMLKCRSKDTVDIVLLTELLIRKATEEKEGRNW